MHSQSGGTLTAICMLIPLVAVPYFAIRGTKDLDGQFPSLNGKDEIAFASTEGFEEASAELSAAVADAPPFPSDDSVVLDSGVPGAPEGDWSNPFDNGQPRGAFEDQLQESFDEFRDDLSQKFQPSNSSGLSGTQQRAGSTSIPTPTPTQSQRPQTPVQRVSSTKVRTQWQDLVNQLKNQGMRNYRVETVPDKSVYYVTAFFPNPRSGVTRRFEGEGQHPLTALRSVMQQVADSQGGLAR